MPLEIERKFLIQPSRLPMGLFQRWEKLSQGYLSREPVVRVRWVELPEPAQKPSEAASHASPAPNNSHSRGYLTIKGPGTLVRSEFEYEIPADEAKALLELCAHRLEKTRYFLPVGRHVWEVDRFHGRLEGLWVAEIELSDVDEDFERPEWVGAEVTGDVRYSNSQLAAASAPPGL